jgi:hypothetical protein
MYSSLTSKSLINALIPRWPKSTPKQKPQESTNKPISGKHAESSSSISSNRRTNAKMEEKQQDTKLKWTESKAPEQEATKSNDCLDDGQLKSRKQSDSSSWKRRAARIGNSCKRTAAKIKPWVLLRTPFVGPAVFTYQVLQEKRETRRELERFTKEYSEASRRRDEDSMNQAKSKISAMAQ